MVSLGSFGLDGINLSAILSGGLKIVVGIILMLLAGFVFFMWTKNKKSKRLYAKTIHFFEEVNGNMVPVEHKQATIITVPNTNIEVFYIKDYDLYMPRLTKRMGKDAYWVCRKNNRELVNFTMKNLNEDMTEAGLDYDHTDMRYSHTNLREIIKKNYRDKSQPWYMQYRNEIALIIIVFVLTVSIWFVLHKTGALIGRLEPLIKSVDQLVQNAGTLKNSGVIQAAA